MRRAFQSSVFFLCVLFSVAGAYNVLSDNADVERLAQEVACSAAGPADPHAPRSATPAVAAGTKPADAACRAQKTRMERTPIAQTFDFATTKRTVTVRCVRSAFLVGDYGCELR